MSTLIIIRFITQLKQRFLHFSFQVKQPKKNQSITAQLVQTITREMNPEAPEVTLQPFDLADLDDYYAWASDDRVSAWCRWDTYTNKEALLDYMKNGVLPHPWMRAICCAGRPVGAISVSPYNGEDRCRAELGYVLAAEYWGKGIVTRAVKLVLEAAFKELKDLVRIEALVDVDNVGSQKVLEKSGFTKDGVLRRFTIRRGKVRDRILYSFISTDPPLV